VGSRATSCAQGKLGTPRKVLIRGGFAAPENPWAQIWAHSSGEGWVLAASTGDKRCAPDDMSRSVAHPSEHSSACSETWLRTRRTFAALIASHQFQLTIVQRASPPPIAGEPSGSTRTTRYVAVSSRAESCSTTCRFTVTRLTAWNRRNCRRISSSLKYATRRASAASRSPERAICTASFAPSRLGVAVLMIGIRGTLQPRRS
jgi:hypothetical protein